MFIPGVILRAQQKKYKKLQGVIIKAWKELESGDRAAKNVLKLCAHVNGPIV